MVELIQICPECKKTYTNGCFTMCGTCKKPLFQMEIKEKIIDKANALVTCVYRITGQRQTELLGEEKE